MQCEHCGTDNEATAHFCGDCGTPLETNIDQIQVDNSDTIMSPATPLNEEAKTVTMSQNDVDNPLEYERVDKLDAQTILSKPPPPQSIPSSDDSDSETNWMSQRNIIIAGVLFVLLFCCCCFLLVVSWVIFSGNVDIPQATALPVFSYLQGLVVT